MESDWDEINITKDSIVDKEEKRGEKKLDLHQRAAAEGNPQVKTLLQRQIDATDKQIDRLVYGLYGLTEAEIAGGGKKEVLKV